MLRASLLISFLILILILPYCSGKPTEYVSSEPVTPTNPDSTFFRTFYRDWLFVGTGTTLASFGWYANLDDEANLSRVGGFVMSEGYEVLWVIMGGYYRGIDGAYLPRDQISKVGYLEEYYFWVGFETTGVKWDDGAFALIFETNLNDPDEIVRRIEEYATTLNVSGLRAKRLPSEARSGH